MPVTVTSAISGPYTPNGVTVSFPFDFKADSASEVKVIDQDGTELSTGLYSVALATGEGGTVTFSVAPSASDYAGLFVISDPALTQTADFGNTGPSFNPAALTRAFDRSAVRDLKQQMQLDRAITVPFGESPADFIADGQVVGKVAGKFVGIGNNVVEAAQYAADAEMAALLASVQYIASAAEGTAGGIARTADGERFAVVSDDEYALALYRNDAGVATDLGYSVPSLSKINSAVVATTAEGATQIAAVAGAGTTQVAAVQSEGTTQIDAVNTAGAAQIAGATTQALIATEAAALATSLVNPTEMLEITGLDIPAAPTWQSSSGRLKRIASGVWALTAGNEPRIYVEGGVTKGVLLDPAATLKGMPVHQALPTGSTSAQYVTKSVVGSTVEHATTHAYPDMFGGTGKGIRILASSTSSSFYFENNQTAIVSGDKPRWSVVFWVNPIGSSQEWRMGWNALSGTAPATTLNMVFDTSGVLSSQTAPSGTGNRGACVLLDTLPGGQKLYLAYVEHTATATATVRPNMRANTTGADMRIQGAHTGLNLASYVATLPVYENKAYLADGIKLSHTVAVEAEFVGLACNRSRIEPGAVITAPTTRATPVLPLETRIIIRPSTEASNADSIYPSPTMDAQFATGSAVLADAYFDVDFLQTSATPVVSFLSAFTAPERKGSIRSFTGNTASTSVTLGVHVWRRASVDDYTFYNVQPKAGSFTMLPGCTIYGCARSHTRQYAGQVDEDKAFGGDKCEYYGRGVGGTLTGTYTISMDQVEFGYLYQGTGGGPTGTGTVSITNSFFHDAQADFHISGTGVQSWTRTGNLYLHHSYRPLDFVQSQDQIEVDTGSGRVALSASTFTASTLPVGRKFTKYGTRSGAGAAITLAPDYNASLVVTAWIAPSGTDKPGYQFTATRPRRTYDGVETETPVVDFEVFVADGGAAASPTNPHIYITTQLGEWTTSSVYTPGTVPATSSAGIHGDCFQISATGATMENYVDEDNIYLTGSQGIFLRSKGEGASGASVIKTVSVKRNLILVPYDQALTLFGPNDATGIKTASNNLIAAPHVRQRFAGGSSQQPKIIVTGATAQFAGSGNVVAVGVGQVAASPTLGATPPGYSTIGAYRYDTYTPRVDASGIITTDHIFDESCLHPITRMPLIDFDLLKFTSMASALLGFNAQGLVDTIRAGVYTKNAVWRAMVTYMSQPPDYRATVPAAAAVGTTVLTGLKGKSFDRKYGGNARGYFKLEGGKIAVASALTGLNRIFLLITDAGERVLVDVTP